MLATELTKGERTRAAILDAAADLFMTNGFSGTSMRQIAEQVGIALGGIYNHFESKEDIFTAVVLDRHPINALVPLLLESEGQTQEQLLREGVQQIVAALGEKKLMLQLMFIEQIEFNNRHVPLLYEALFPNIVMLVQKLSAMPGSLKPYPPFVVIRAFLGLVVSYAFFEMMLADLPLPEDIDIGTLDDMTDILFYGLLEPEA